jgi:hypothetical protein
VIGNKTLNELAATHDDKITCWSKDVDGYWLYLKYGWQWGGGHMIHEMTIKEVIAEFRKIEPCDCIECKTQGRKFRDYDYDTKKWVTRTRKGVRHG